MMVQKKKRKNKLQRPLKILKIYCYTPISKPLNGSLPQSNSSHLLRLYPVEYSYKKGKDKRTSYTETYFIKGLRGVIRHQVMKVCFEHGLEVCHTSDKKVDKHGNCLLPNGFHLLGTCQENGECIVHQVFGSMRHEGLISVYANPITSIPHKTAKMAVQLQKVHIASENRVAQTFDGNTIQDFSERYFSGEFSYEIDVTRCNPVQIGLLLEAVINLQKLGRGFNSGYGRIQVVKFQLLERTITRVPEWEKNCFVVKEVIEEVSLKHDVLDAMQSWHQ
jgi:hypothetical protein